MKGFVIMLSAATNTAWTARGLKTLKRIRGMVESLIDYLSIEKSDYISGVLSLKHSTYLVITD